MDEGQIFGSDISLPSLPGLQSDCEEEILLLMKEVDCEFQRKHHSLLTELMNVRSLCLAQRDEIENLRLALQSSSVTVQNDNSKDKIEECMKEIEKLKKENDGLRTENGVLQRRIQMLPKNDFQIDNLKRSLSLQQDENKVLREQLFKMEQQHGSLQNSYKRVADALGSFNQNDNSQEKHRDNNLSSPNFKEPEIIQLTEKSLAEEQGHYNVIIPKLNQKLDDLENEIQKDTS